MKQQNKTIASDTQNTNRISFPFSLLIYVQFLTYESSTSIPYPLQPLVLYLGSARLKFLVLFTPNSLYSYYMSFQCSAFCVFDLMLFFLCSSMFRHLSWVLLTSHGTHLYIRLNPNSTFTQNYLFS